MSHPSPSYYEEIPANEAVREASESVKKASAGGVDLLPFRELGGRRFEILAYLMLLNPPAADGLIVRLVKASSDKGRDVITHLNGKLRSVIQCKALDEPFTRPALVRELVKLAVFDYLKVFSQRPESSMRCGPREVSPSPPSNSQKNGRICGKNRERYVKYMCYERRLAL